MSLLGPDRAQLRRDWEVQHLEAGISDSGLVPSHVTSACPVRLRLRQSRGVGALVVCSARGYVPPPDRLGSYVLLLLTSRSYARHGVGTRPVERAIVEAWQRVCDQLRVDAWVERPHWLLGTSATAFGAAGPLSSTAGRAELYDASGPELSTSQGTSGSDGEARREGGVRRACCSPGARDPGPTTAN